MFVLFLQIYVKYRNPFANKAKFIKRKIKNKAEE